MADSKRVWPASVPIVVGILGLIPAYFIFWDQPRLVYESRQVEIPLSPAVREGFEKALGASVQALGVEKLPDKLVYVTVQNNGHKPSNSIKGVVSVPGRIVDKDLKGPQDAYARELTLDSATGSQVSFSCQFLVHGRYPITLSIWYAEDRPEQMAEIALSDSKGAAMSVESLETDTTRWQRHIYFVLILIGGAGLGVLQARVERWLDRRVKRPG